MKPRTNPKGTRSQPPNNLRNFVKKLAAEGLSGDVIAAHQRTGVKNSAPKGLMLVRFPNFFFKQSHMADLKFMRVTHEVE
jgi:hypothetical protein